MVEHILAGGGQGCQRAAMEGIDKRDDLAAALAIRVYAVFAGTLNGTLVGFGTRVAEEYSI